MRTPAPRPVIAPTVPALPTSVAAPTLAPLAPAPAPWQRPLDLVLTLALLPWILPLALVLALAVRFDSPGPAVFVQERLGQGGRRFKLYKLRSMRQDADEDAHRQRVARLLGEEGRGQAWGPAAADPRVTRLGRFLRRWGLDELPQFYNVLRGDMSLVGPRPALPYEAELWEPWHRQRLSARPGLTGLWQVEGRAAGGDRQAAVDFDGMVRLDLDYLRRRSLALDLSILARTPAALWRRRPADGLPQVRPFT